MSIKSQKLDAITAYILATSDEERMDAQNALKRLSLTPEKEENMDTGDLEIMIHELFLEIGLPAHLTGYKLIVTAVMEAANNVYFTDDMTCGVYPYLAKVHNTTSSRAERAIRHCIEVLFTTGNYNKLNKIFGSIIDPGKGRPTNSQFISTLGNYMRIQYQKR